jgi:predicted RNA binding protein YcfA (HicA-like mRNA interferase family)
MKAPRVSGKEILAALERAGFVVSHVRGSHHYLRRAGVMRLVVVPVHGAAIVPQGTLRSILRQADMSVEQFVDLLQA